MRNQIFLVLLFMGIAGYVFSETCPGEEDIDPCVCDDEEDGEIVISCYEQDTTLEQVKKALSYVSGKKKVHVDLEGINLGKVPSNFFKSLDIKRLSISHSELESLSDSDDIPPLSGLEDSLEELGIMNSFSEENGPTKLKLGHLRRLRELDLSYNIITEISNDWFEEAPPALEILIISNNGVEKLGDRAFSNLNNLIELSLDGNRFGPILRSMLPSSAQSLATLELDNNALTSIPEDLFSNMPSLETVSLRNNGIVRLEERTWQPVWQQLDELHLEGNDLECDSKMSWMFNLERPVSIYGTCRFPREKAGMDLDDFIDNKGQ